MPVKYVSRENDYTIPKIKEDDGNIYSEIVDTNDLETGQRTDKDGYELPLQKPSWYSYWLKLYIKQTDDYNNMK